MNVDVKGRKRNRNYQFDGVTAFAKREAVDRSYVYLILVGKRNNPALKVRYARYRKAILAMAAGRAAKKLRNAKLDIPEPRGRRTFDEMLADAKAAVERAAALRDL